MFTDCFATMGHMGWLTPLVILLLGRGIALHDAVTRDGVYPTGVRGPHHRIRE